MFDMEILNHHAMTCCQNGVITGVLSIEQGPFTFYNNARQGDILLVDINRFPINTWHYLDHIASNSLSNCILNDLSVFDYMLSCLCQNHD